MTTQVKVCCINSVAEAQLAIQYGASAIGLVGHMPTGPGVITDDQIRRIAQAVPSGIETFLLTSKDNARDIAEHCLYCATTTVQIVRHISPSEYPILSQRVPETRLVQVIHIEDESALELIEPYEPFVDAFLLDSGRPGKSELGGTGNVHDWSVSAKFVQQTTRPVYLAGGLTPQNVTSAIRTVRPFGVDLCSGIRVDDSLNESSLKQFMAQVRE